MKSYPVTSFPRTARFGWDQFNHPPHSPDPALAISIFFAPEIAFRGGQKFKINDNSRNFDQSFRQHLHEDNERSMKIIFYRTVEVMKI